jgi:hypothetical protein
MRDGRVHQHEQPERKEFGTRRDPQLNERRHEPHDRRHGREACGERPAASVGLGRNDFSELLPILPIATEDGKANSGGIWPRLQHMLDVSKAYFDGEKEAGLRPDRHIAAPTDRSLTGRRDRSR